MSNIQLVAVDLDRTLLNSDHVMTERNEQALKKAIEQGVKVIIATGKTQYSARDIIKKLDLDTPGIYVQGLVIHYADGTTKHLSTLPAEILRSVITFAEDRGFETVIYAGSRVLIKAESPDANELSEEYDEPAPEVVGPLQNILDEEKVNKLLVIKRHNPRKVTALRWQLSMQLDGKAKLVQALDDMLEVVPKNSSKGTALKALLKELDIAPENVLAIGDGENDIEMIQLAGIGVAVGNASEKLKAVADHVVKSNDEDGVADALEKFVLKAEEPAKDTESTTDETNAVSETEPPKETTDQTESKESES